jgi:EAL domain-containing protein (putative c-di-GMP-specific phosphodiesterase class I)
VLPLKQSDRRTSAKAGIAQDFAPQFMPMWDAHNEAITSYLCSPRRVGFWESIAQSKLTSKERARVELSCLSQGTAILASHLHKGERFLMTFRITFETLSSPAGRTEFTSACCEIPVDLRPYILFELAEVPGGTPRSRVADLVMGLRPYSKAVIAQVAIGGGNYATYREIGLQAIGINVRRTKLPANEIADEIIKLCDAAKRIAVSTVLNGVSDSQTLHAARNAGVHFMTGRVIAPFLLEPGPMRRLSWRDVEQTAQQADKAA